MIKQKITKDKFIAIIHAITGITNKLRNDTQNMRYDVIRARTNAYLYIMDDLCRKMRSKLVLIENKPGTYSINLAVNEMQAFVLNLNKGICKYDPYTDSVFHELCDNLFKKLLQ